MQQVDPNPNELTEQELLLNCRRALLMRMVGPLPAHDVKTLAEAYSLLWSSD